MSNKIHIEATLNDEVPNAVIIKTAHGHAHKMVVDPAIIKPCKGSVGWFWDNEDFRRVEHGTISEIKGEYEHRFREEEGELFRYFSLIDPRPKKKVVCITVDGKSIEVPDELVQAILKA